MNLRNHDLSSLRSIKEFIDKNIAAHFTLDDLARKAGINKDKLTKGFKQEYKKTVFAYLREARLCKAKELLENSPLSEPVIAKRTGFKSVKGFINAFKKKYNCLPHTLRKK